MANKGEITPPCGFDPGAQVSRRGLPCLRVGWRRACPLYLGETMNLTDRKSIMKQWDAWRKYIANGGKGSWPRDAFESLLDAVDEMRSNIKSLIKDWDTPEEDEAWKDL